MKVIGLQQKDAFAGDLAFGGLTLKAPPPRPEAVAAMDRVRGQKADVVPVAGVARPGIAEPREQEHERSPRTARLRPLLLLPCRRLGIGRWSSALRGSRTFDGCSTFDGGRRTFDAFDDPERCPLRPQRLPRQQLRLPPSASRRQLFEVARGRARWSRR